MKIHKEGQKLLFWMLMGLVAFSIVLHQLVPEYRILLNVVILFSVVIYLLVLQFFRNPSLVMPTDENLVYAPADAKVEVIEETMEEEEHKEMIRQLNIFMSTVNVH